jgi:hypothetical protein
MRQQIYSDIAERNLEKQGLAGDPKAYIREFERVKREAEGAA